jgi:hypothetical protein
MPCVKANHPGKSLGVSTECRVRQYFRGYRAHPQEIEDNRHAIIAKSKPVPSRFSSSERHRRKTNGFSQLINELKNLALGQDSAEHPLKPSYKTQNQAKRFNKLDNRNCFGTRAGLFVFSALAPQLVTTVVHQPAPWDSDFHHERQLAGTDIIDFSRNLPTPLTREDHTR